MPALEPHNAESTTVQLTRMEGKFDLVLERTVNLIARMDRVEERVTTQEATVLRLDLDANARDKTAIALALALKEAEETRRNKSEQTWSPFAKTITAILVVVALASLYIQSTH